MRAALRLMLVAAFLIGSLALGGCDREIEVGSSRLTEPNMTEPNLRPNPYGDDKDYMMHMP